MEAWKYLAIAIVMASGLAGVFFAKDGQINKIRGVGWVAVVLIIVAGGIAGYQAHRDAEKGRLAARAAEQAEADLRRTQAALLIGVISGADLSEPVGLVNFLLEVPMVGDAEKSDLLPTAFPGFVGPFPELPLGGAGKLELAVGEEYYEATLKPAPGGLRIEAPFSYTVKPNPNGAEFLPIGKAPDAEAPPTDGQWFSQPEANEPYSYGVTFKLDIQGRGLVQLLSETSTYGRLSFTIPRLSLKRRQEIISVFEKDISPSIVLGLSVPSSDREDGCVRRIRVPMHFVASEESQSRSRSDHLEFSIQGDAKGFKNELCGYTP